MKSLFLFIVQTIKKTNCINHEQKNYDVSTRVVQMNAFYVTRILFFPL